MSKQMSAIVQQTVNLRVSAHLNALRPAACAHSCHFAEGSGARSARGKLGSTRAVRTDSSEVTKGDVSEQVQRCSYSSAKSTGAFTHTKQQQRCDSKATAATEELLADYYLSMV
eukprot:7292-Heterococcus_DN1.PRE.1